MLRVAATLETSFTVRAIVLTMIKPIADHFPMNFFVWLATILISLTLKFLRRDYFIELIRYNFLSILTASSSLFEYLRWGSFFRVTFLLCLLFHDLFRFL